jgi:hypothetical protein
LLILPPPTAKRFHSPFHFERSARIYALDDGSLAVLFLGVGLVELIVLSI